MFPMGGGYSSGPPDNSYTTKSSILWSGALVLTALAVFLVDWEVLPWVFIALRGWMHDYKIVQELSAEERREE